MEDSEGCTICPFALSAIAGSGQEDLLDGRVANGGAADGGDEAPCFLSAPEWMCGTADVVGAECLEGLHGGSAGQEGTTAMCLGLEDAWGNISARPREGGISTPFAGGGLDPSGQATGQAPNGGSGSGRASASSFEHSSSDAKVTRTDSPIPEGCMRGIKRSRSSSSTASEECDGGGRQRKMARQMESQQQQHAGRRVLDASEFVHHIRHLAQDGISTHRQFSKALGLLGGGLMHFYIPEWASARTRNLWNGWVLPLCAPADFCVPCPGPGRGREEAEQVTAEEWCTARAEVCTLMSGLGERLVWVFATLPHILNLPRAAAMRGLEGFRKDVFAQMRECVRRKRCDMVSARRNEQVSQWLNEVVREEVRAELTS